MIAGLKLENWEKENSEWSWSSCSQWRCGKGRCSDSSNNFIFDEYLWKSEELKNSWWLWPDLASRWRYSAEQPHLAPGWTWWQRFSLLSPSISSPLSSPLSSLLSSSISSPLSSPLSSSLSSPSHQYKTYDMYYNQHQHQPHNHHQRYDHHLLHHNPCQATTLAVFPENSQVLANTPFVFTSLTTSFPSPCTAGTHSIP